MRRGRIRRLPADGGSPGEVPLLKPPGKPAVLQTVLPRDMLRSHSRPPPAELVLARAQTAKTPLLPTRNALAKAGSPDECAAATVKAYTVACEKRIG